MRWHEAKNRRRVPKPGAPPGKPRAPPRRAFLAPTRTPFLPISSTFDWNCPLLALTCPAGSLDLAAAEPILCALIRARAAGVFSPFLCVSVNSTPRSAYATLEARSDGTPPGVDDCGLHPPRLLVAQPRCVAMLTSRSENIMSTRCYAGILVLNICLILPLLTSSVNGLDSSLVNGAHTGTWRRVGHRSSCAGLQILPDWQAYFKYPNGTALGR